jgi:ArsR family transcriptional regulator, arsenate/arsenite/antimonite-responsive transcriptional repressor
MTVAAPRKRFTPDVIGVFHALSDETRLAVLDMLRAGERCVCDLQDAVGAAQSRLSFHLKVLKDAGLVTDRREGRWAYYSLNSARIAEATAALGALTASSPRAGGLKLHALGRASSAVGSVAERQPRGARATTERRGGDCC